MSIVDHGIMYEHDHVVLHTNSGRTIHLWLHECDACVSLDVWTDRDRAVEFVSANTGDTTRAPIGVMGWRRGTRIALKNIEDVEGTAECVGRMPVSSVTLLWNDKAES